MKDVFNVNAKDLTFGIEIECQLPDEHREMVNIGRYHRGQEQAWLPEGWNVQSDGSLIPNNGFFACEIVSPILKGEDGLTQVVYVLDVLTNLGATVNQTMGTHIHVGVDKIAEANALETLKQNYLRVEKVFYKANGKSAKVRHEGKFCKPGIGEGLIWKEILNADGTTGRIQVKNRCYGLNLTNEKTVEFRLWRPGVDAIQAVGAISLCVALVLFSIDGLTLPEVTDRKTALQQLFYRQGCRIVDDREVWTDENGKEHTNEGEIWDILLHMSHQVKQATI